MTHPKEAIEAVARALHDAAYDGNWDHKHMDPTFRAIFTAEATALLDLIAPMLVAAEREACAAGCGGGTGGGAGTGGEGGRNHAPSGIL